MRTVYKYDLFANDETQEVKVPQDSQIIHVASQRPEIPDVVQVWMLVDPETEDRVRRFRVVGTGHQVPHDGVHRGSAITFGGSLVWHVIEVG